MLIGEGGGTGITTMPVLQSLAQAREKWSENAAGAIWDASIVKIVLGGASNSKDLHDLTTLIGERDEVTDSTTVGDPLRATLHPPRADHAARHDPHPPVRDCTGAAALRTTHRHPDADLDRPARRETAARRPGRHRGDAAAPLGGAAGRTCLTERIHRGVAADVRKRGSPMALTRRNPSRGSSPPTRSSPTRTGDARFYAKIGQEHYRKEPDGSFTQTETTFHDLVAFKKTAERAHDRLAKGDKFVAEGYTREYDRATPEGEVVKSEVRREELGHDLARTSYEVDRTRRQPATTQEPVGQAAGAAHRESSGTAPALGL